MDYYWVSCFQNIKIFLIYLIVYNFIFDLNIFIHVFKKITVWYYIIFENKIVTFSFLETYNWKLLVVKRSTKYNLLMTWVQKICTRYISRDMRTCFGSSTVTFSVHSMFSGLYFTFWIVVLILKNQQIIVWFNV